MQLLQMSLPRLAACLLAFGLCCPSSGSAQDAVAELMDKSKSFMPQHHDSALYYANQAIHLAEFEENDRSVADTYHWRGQVHQERQAFTEAQQDLRHSYEVERILRNKAGEAQNLLALAHLFLAQDSLDSAHTYFLVAVPLLESLDQKNALANTWLDLGELENRTDRSKQSYASYRKGLEIAQQTQDKALIARANQLLGFHYLEKEQYSRAQNHLRNAFNTFKRLHNQDETARAIYGLACVDRMNKRYAVAEDYAQRGLQQAKAIGSRSLTMQFYQLLGDLMTDRNQTEAAGEYYQLNKLIRDSLLGNTDAQTLSNVITKYEQEKLRLENEKNTQEIKLKDATIALSKKELQNERLKFYFILGGLILVALFGGFLARAVVLKNRANRRLQTALDNLKTAQAQLIRTEKLASLGQVTAGIAHEIRNPLNFVNSLSRLSVDMVDEVAEELTELQGQSFEGPPAGMVFEYFQDIRTNTGKVLEHGQRASRIVTDMLQHAGTGEKAREQVALNAFVEEYVQLAFHSMRGQAEAFDCALEYALAPGAGEVSLIRSDLGRALLNIVSNAFEAMAGRVAAENSGYSPHLLVRTRRLSDFIEIAIADNGPGVPALDRERIFEPFFTTKPPNKGTGLGLSLAYDTVVKSHGGELLLRDSDHGGAEFLIRIPLK